MTEVMSFATGAESNAYQWTREAFYLIDGGHLHVEVTASSSRDLVATGQCPRCKHDVAYEQSQRIALPQGAGRRALAESSAGTQPAGTPVAYTTYTVMCWCAELHPGRPADVRGCGAVFHVNLPAS